MMTRALSMTFLLLLCVGCTVDRELTRLKAQDLVNQSAQMVTMFRGDTDQSPLEELLQQARAVLVFPAVSRGGIILGATGGSGVLVARDADGSWSAPAFISIGGLTFGAQLGLESNQAVILLMNQTALLDAITQGLNLGATASVSAGSASALAMTSIRTFDNVHIFTDGRGLYGGLTVDFGSIRSKQEYDHAYYGTGARTLDIVVNRRFDVPGSAPLKESLAPYE